MSTNSAPQSNPKRTPPSELIKRVAKRVFVTIPIIFAVIFLPAGTLNYWEGWVYLVILFIPMFFVISYLLINEPDLLERRMKMREKEGTQKLIIKISYLTFLLAFILPGLDKRLGWSHVPLFVVIIADLFVLLGYGVFVLVIKENRYASRIIEVEQCQKVISSGPYKIVRHPMYLGLILLYLASPIALGSYWALIPATMIVPILIARIINEEKVLESSLDGYYDYQRKTRYRLFPGVW